MMDISGIYPPIPTPFNIDESVAYDRLEDNLRRWISLPLNGVVMPGSNSEVVYLTKEERVSIWELCVVTLAGSGKYLIAGTGAETTSETIELTCKAASFGAKAALVMPPFYYKASMNHKALVNHYTLLAKASPIPVIIYNVPVFTGIDFAIDTLKALAEIPNIIGIKDSSSNIIKMSQLLSSFPKFQVFCGTGSAFLPFLSIGAVGGVMALANIAATPLRFLLDAFKENRQEDAIHIQRDLVDINTFVTSGFGVPGLKYAMDKTGFYGGPTRLPLLPLSSNEMLQIDPVLDKLKSKYPIVLIGK
jgi:4-hydroxy-2-oxoglutarate aldolase